MNEVIQEMSAKVDAGLALLLIVIVGIIMFWIGLMTPFIVMRFAKRFHIEFGEFFKEEDDDE